jgi:heavy metal sensor kinase
MQRLGVPAASTDRQQFADAQYGDLPVRILTAPATAGSRNFVVQVAEPMDDFVEAIDRFRSVLWFGIPVLLLAAAGGGYWLSAFALRPVDRMTSVAQTITPQDLSRRVSVPQTGDELQRLGETLNKMLQQIESAVLRITQFTADASHELRTPVALIRTRAEVTLAKPRTNDQYREALSEVLFESERTSALIENLMLLARADTGAETLDYQRTDVSALARAVSAQAQTLAEAKELKWNAAVPDVPIWVLGDPQALRRLLLILIDNAVKYTPENGSISLALETYDNHAAIRVEDTGMGISEADLPHIFERFYRADKARSRELGGTGLGLSIGRWIANAHSGEIKVESSTAGSTFVFRLPLLS